MKGQCSVETIMYQRNNSRSGIALLLFGFNRPLCGIDDRLSSCSPDKRMSQNLDEERAAVRQRFRARPEGG